MIPSLSLPLPPSPESLADATWEDIAPYYESLAEQPLTLENVEEWLASWSRLEELVGEASVLASIAYTSDTTDPAKEAAHLRFAAEISPRRDEQEVRLARRLLELGWSRSDMEMALRRFATDAEIFREENLPHFAALEELESGYEKVVGAITVDWEGERKTVAQLQPFLKSPQRPVRERAFRAMAAPYMSARDELADLFDEMYARRQRIAHNAGFADFRGYIFAAKHRFDYTPEDCARFHRGVEATVVPALGRLHAERSRTLRLTPLRPWDLHVDEQAAPPLVPFQGADELVARSRRVFERVDAELGERFRDMAEAGLLDLESRPGKAPGGYCATLPFRGKPFVFMNAVGVPDDVSTLVHEAGHCFHSFATRALPYVWQRRTGMEAAELASMSMELLAMPHLARPDGFYEPPDVRRAWLEQLEDTLAGLAHIACVDAFQAWLYTSGQGGNREARDAVWLEIRQRFEPSVDWSGLEGERIARWYRQAHIFVAPFYYIEYGIAQLGALQVWRASLEDPLRAVTNYKSALALGGTRPLPEMYAAAGAALMFDGESMAPLVDLLERRIMELRSATRNEKRET